MGRDKATLVVDGQPMARRVADILRAAGAAEVVAIGGDPHALASLGLTVVPDDEPGHGPFAATLTALRHAPTELLAVLSCDLVTPRAEAVRTVVGALAAAGSDVVGAIPCVDGELQWTHAAWRAAALPRLEAARASGAASLRRACAALPVVTVNGLSPADVADADDPGDLPEHG